MVQSFEFHLHIVSRKHIIIFTHLHEIHFHGLCRKHLIIGIAGSVGGAYYVASEGQQDCNGAVGINGNVFGRESFGVSYIVGFGIDERVGYGYR